MREAAGFFKLLADEARLKMLWLLFNRRELCVCDFMAVLEITQSKASRHLAALRNAGLVHHRKEGLWSYYSLRPVEDELEEAHLRLLRKSLSKRRDAKQLLSKLNTWLKLKQRKKVYLQDSSLLRLIKTVRSGSKRKTFTGGAR